MTIFVTTVILISLYDKQSHPEMYGRQSQKGTIEEWFVQ
jgi:hypothetical protein